MKNWAKTELLRCFVHQAKTKKKVSLIGSIPDRGSWIVTENYSNKWQWKTFGWVQCNSSVMGKILCTGGGDDHTMTLKMEYNRRVITIVTTARFTCPIKPWFSVLCEPRLIFLFFPCKGKKSVVFCCSIQIWQSMVCYIGFFTNLRYIGSEN